MIRPTLPAVAVAAIAAACLAPSALHRRAVSSQLRQWSEALELIKAFGDSSGLSSEIAATIGLGTLPMRNMALLAAVQADVDRRDASSVIPELDQDAQPVSSPALSEASLMEASKYMRFASAAYGAALMVVYGLIPAAPRVELDRIGRQRMSELVWDSRSAICHHTGCAPSDLVRAATESLDVAGSADCLRHFVAIDRAGGAVVLALRGTASISDVLHDAIACASRTCPMAFRTFRSRRRTCPSASA